MLVRVAPASSEAPETLEGIYDGLRYGMHHVWSGASDKTVFSTPKMNHVYRTVHDFYHAVFNRDTTPEDEILLWGDIERNTSKALPESQQARLLYWVEHIGQVKHHLEHGDFPDNQVLFTMKKLVSMGYHLVNIPEHWLLKAGIAYLHMDGSRLTEQAINELLK